MQVSILYRRKKVDIAFGKFYKGYFQFNNNINGTDMVSSIISDSSDSPGISGAATAVVSVNPRRKKQGNPKIRNLNKLLR